jgi:pimeloyl-ACP methyl ester carboxylesterase
MTDSKSSTDNRARSKKSNKTAPSRWAWTAGAAAGGAALAGAALFNWSKAKQAERDNPPLGEFVTVDGVRLHYLERGEGSPIVLLHGNGTMIEDWLASGLFDQLAKNNRVIAFDRPGFGHSERPRSTIWTPRAQAALIAAALDELKVEKPLVVGHSFGTLVALALALDHADKVSALALIGGYYFASVRGDVLVASQPAVPVVGDVMRYTVSPLLGAALTPRLNARIFNPAPVPESWTEGFPMQMTLRPSQIRAEAAEAALMIPAAASMAPRLEELDLPVTIIAGDGDEMVETAAQSKRLADALPQSRYIELEGAGHMVHHTATRKVAEAIGSAAATRKEAEQRRD